MSDNAPECAAVVEFTKALGRNSAAAARERMIAVTRMNDDGRHGMQARQGGQTQAVSGRVRHAKPGAKISNTWSPIQKFGRLASLLRPTSSQ